MEHFGEDEGELCNREGCTGIMWLPPVEGCSCHIAPPCSQCENNHIVCKECGADPDDDIVFLSEEKQKKNDAMERAEYMRDREKDEGTSQN